MSQNSAPVINPSDLAAIIARDHGRGFAANPHRQSGIAAGDGFLPSNFAMEALRIVPPPEGDAHAGDQDQTAHIMGFADQTAQPAAPERDVEAELAAAFARGKEAGLNEGLAKGRAELAAAQQANAASDLSSARAVFLRAADFLTSAKDSMSSDIALSVETAVLRLAALRAGQAISDCPKPFLHRIEQIADRVTQGVRAVRVALHPDDLALAEDHLLGFLPPGSLLLADPALMRGDIVVRAPSVCVSDLLMGAQQ